ncbi:hypothetical protein [Nostocoides sp. HKS02]|uniref:hypothetical protein n=1 Tax=Nostocoides sp. HKS02 TaxID=1813880 RepID=UPI0012B46CC8|nr:hypothetical protein [Tetrasphaera sp. HKS02]QGN58852.1 hypothetical protein GKE56_14265 [Tetrasphaera sp. HKS02]
MDTTRRTVCRVLALIAIAAGLCLAVSGSASASPSFPGIPDCKDAPTAQLPGSGITGFLDEGPKTPPAPMDPFVAHPRTSVYEQYGYAGLSWQTYDLGCGGGLRDINASMDTATGNLLLSAATWGTAATNGLHNKVAHPEQYMAPLDDVVAAVTQRLHDSIWSPWGGAALLGVGALLLFYSLHGRLSAVTSAAAWALLVLTVVAGIGQYPTRVATFFDGTVTSSISAINSGVGGLTNLPASSDPARAQGALVVDRVLYDNWLRGELGSSDSPAAKRWGPTLFKASAFTWAEAAQAAKDPEAGRRMAEKKAEEWKATAADIQQNDPVAYSALQGKAGGRTGTGLMVALGSTFSLLFRLVADIFLFAGLVMLRLLVMLFPAVAVVGVMAPMAAIVRRVFAMGGAAIINVIAFSAGSAVHTTVISAVLSRATNAGMGVLGLVLCLVVTAAAFVVLYPLLSFTSILGQSGEGHRLLRRGGREVWNYALRRQATKDGITAGEHELEEQQMPVPTTSTTPSRTVRLVNLPAETFSRPAASGFPDLRDGERFLRAPAHMQLSSVEDPRAHHGGGARDVSASDAFPSADATREDPAYVLAGGVDATVTPGTERQPLVERGQVLSGVLVDEVPQNARALDNLAHDSHTLFRRDGIGPRLYDPDTRRTVPSVQDRSVE